MSLVADYHMILDNKPLNFINKMLIYKYKKGKEQRQWEMYLVNYGNMDKDNFKEYKNMLEYKISERSTEDIVREAQEIQAKINAGKEAK